VGGDEEVDIAQQGARRSASILLASALGAVAFGLEAERAEHNASRAYRVSAVRIRS
jgi:hypothetical protein